MTQTVGGDRPGGRSVRIADCTGLWRRTLLVDGDGSEDKSTDVRWLQGITAFVDLRRPAPRPDFGGAQDGPKLTACQRDWLSSQDGFAGRLGQRGDVFEWSHFMRLQPPGPHPDAGRMRWRGDTLVEVGVHEDYVEHWARDDGPVSPCWALRADAPDGSEALLLRVGDLFGWARRAAHHMDISLGTVVDDGWLITDSALPHREGRQLGPRLHVNELSTEDVDDGGKRKVRRWNVKDSEGIVEL
ncbi:MAG: hypothetical protein QOE41_3282 [Mycobacterium sp.]|jgi:hypothetical protein|nr:hypothetical protein [Mycobacterium sp.]